VEERLRSSTKSRNPHNMTYVFRYSHLFEGCTSDVLLEILRYMFESERYDSLNAIDFTSSRWTLEEIQTCLDETIDIQKCRARRSVIVDGAEHPRDVENDVRELVKEFVGDGDEGDEDGGDFATPYPLNN